MHIKAQKSSAMRFLELVGFTRLNYTVLHDMKRGVGLKSTVLVS